MRDSMLAMWPCGMEEGSIKVEEIFAWEGRAVSGIWGGSSGEVWDHRWRDLPQRREDISLLLHKERKWQWVKVRKGNGILSWWILFSLSSGRFESQEA